MRAVLDVNVLISAILSPTGTPARLLLAWQTGTFELVISPALLDELRRALAYPKLRRLIHMIEAEAFVAWITEAATLARDPAGPPPVDSPDPGDAYLLALADAADAVLVTGDRHLLGLADAFPVRAPARFLSMLDEG